MFASVDSPTRRAVRVVVVGSDGVQHRVRLPSVGGEEAFSPEFLRRLVAFPTRASLVKLAQSVATLRLTDARAPVALPQQVVNSTFGPSLLRAIDDDLIRMVVAAEPDGPASIRIQRATASVVGLETGPNGTLMLRVVASASYSPTSTPAP